MSLPLSVLALQQLFLARLGPRLAELERRLDSDEDLGTLMQRFHSLTGIGGTYGYPRISNLSRECELLCTTALDERRFLTPPEVAQIQNTIVEIREAAAEQRGS